MTCMQPLPATYSCAETVVMYKDTRALLGKAASAWPIFMVSSMKMSSAMLRSTSLQGFCLGDFRDLAHANSLKAHEDGD